MSLQLFKNWLVECQMKEPIFFEAATAAFEAMFETTEDVIKIAKQNLGTDEGIGLDQDNEDIGLGDIDSILDQDDIEQPEPINQNGDDEFQKLLDGMDSDDGEEEDNLEVPDLATIPK